MFAVIESGGKQHRVTEGEVLRVEKLNAAAGETIEIDQVLMLGEGGDVKVGAPFVDGGKVSAEVLSHGRGDKIKVIKFRRRQGYMRTQGHRQWYTELKVTGISS